jgi:hypothetical protein
MGILYLLIVFSTLRSTEHKVDKNMESYYRGLAKMNSVVYLYSGREPYPYVSRVNNEWRIVDASTPTNGEDFVYVIWE